MTECRLKVERIVFADERYKEAFYAFQKHVCG